LRLARRVSIFLLACFASNAFAKCSIGNSFAEDAITFLKTVKSIKSYTFESAHEGAPIKMGKVIGFQMTYKFTALRLEPQTGEKSSFLFGVDLPSQNFYAYYTDGISEPYPRLLKGSINEKRCTLEFKASESELLEVELLEGNNMNVFSKHKNEQEKGYSIVHQFKLRSSEIVN